MPRKHTTQLSSLMNDIARIGRNALRKQWKELANELEGDARLVGSAAMLAGGGVALLALSGGLSVLATVHLVQRVTRLPLWASYGLVAGIAAASGVKMLGSAAHQAGEAWPPDLSHAGEALQKGARQIAEEIQETARSVMG